jgi:hypothetical protein
MQTVSVNTPPDATLAALRQEFPGYRVWLEPANGEYRFVARRLHPGTRPHTVITRDPAELRAALAPPQPGSPDLRPVSFLDASENDGADDPAARRASPAGSA